MVVYPTVTGYLVFANAPDLVLVSHPAVTVYLAFANAPDLDLVLVNVNWHDLT
jgi:hypothetical protein